MVLGGNCWCKLRVLRQITGPGFYGEAACILHRKNKEPRGSGREQSIVTFGSVHTIPVTLHPCKLESLQYMAGIRVHHYWWWATLSLNCGDKPRPSSFCRS